MPASYLCKECGKNIPGYAAGGGNGEGRSAEGELDYIVALMCRKEELKEHAIKIFHDIR